MRDRQSRIIHSIHKYIIICGDIHAIKQFLEHRRIDLQSSSSSLSFPITYIVWGGCGIFIFFCHTTTQSESVVGCLLCLCWDIIVVRKLCVTLLWSYTFSFYSSLSLFHSDMSIHNLYSRNYVVGNGVENRQRWFVLFAAYNVASFMGHWLLILRIEMGHWIGDWCQIYILQSEGCQ